MVEIMMMILLVIMLVIGTGDWHWHLDDMTSTSKNIGDSVNMMIMLSLHSEDGDNSITDGGD